LLTYDHPFCKWKKSQGRPDPPKDISRETNGA
jgi:hypothetical protein